MLVLVVRVLASCGTAKCAHVICSDTQLNMQPFLISSPSLIKTPREDAAQLLASY